jgi:hypothetical protein
MQQNKRALLIGLNYPLDVNCKLNGCCNDVRNMAKYLMSTFSFTTQQITTLTDEDLKNAPKVSRDGIVAALYDLCISSWRENLDVVVFHYSGHGSQERDLNADEKTGMDEGIVPMDYMTRGLIIDDLLKEIFMKFNPKTKIICFFDCCHSGTMLDLPFAYDQQKLAESDQIRRIIIPNCPKIYCFSGCMDSQTSMDSVDDSNTPSGAMTAAMLRLLSSKGKMSYPILQFQQDLTNALKTRGYAQRPLLTSSVSVTSFDILF